MQTTTPQEPFLGVLMLDTAFPRVVGDAGNADSYPFAVRIERVHGAGALDIVTDGKPGAVLCDRFITAARRLEKAGAVGLVSTCGFLIHFQRELAAAVDVPVMVSALSLYPSLRHAFGPAPLGILTASAPSLKAGALTAAGIDPAQVHVIGFETCTAFSNTILAAEDAGSQPLDQRAIGDFAVTRCLALLDQHPEVGGFLLECGNLPPYAAAIRAATGKPVFSILDAARLVGPAV